MTPKAVQYNIVSGLSPIGSARNLQEFINIVQSKSFQKICAMAESLITTSNIKAFTIDGVCACCGIKSSFLVDMLHCSQCSEGRWIPNWRERMECPSCKMNNRQRLIATLVKDVLLDRQGQHVYFMEQVTAIFQWSLANLKMHHIVGSEYLGYQYKSGTTIKGIRHEDIENLSFEDAKFDLIVSNDVFEHIPNYRKGLAECYRTLKSGGLMLASIPFHSANNLSTIRAQVINNELEYILPPVYHVNPLSAKGSLVFTDFGWDILDAIKQAGFSDARIDIYGSEKYGHLGNGLLIFRVIK